ncbi:MAG: DUF1559 domain-containing protein [Planctomycetota bacterium]
MLLLLPPLDSGPGHRDATWRMSCSNNLKGIALALHNYHDVYKTFPPAYIKGPNGRRMHSWRVLILPYLEADTCQSLYDAYNFDEPWDGPNNRELALQMPQVFCCPSQCKRGSKPTGLTNYFAVVGENTAWPGEQAIGFRDIIDGSSNTLLLLEVANRPITWTEPTDIEFAEATDILMRREFAPHGYEDFFHDRKLGGCQIALADGSVRFVAQQADDVASKLLIRRNDGEHFDLDSLQKNAAAPMPLRVGNRIRLGVIVLLALGPFPWVWIKPSQRIAPATDQND